MRLRGFDAFCGAGGCTRGYQISIGAHMTGCDLVPQPSYCGDEFVQGDALELLADEGFMAQFDFAHASPPCQFYASLSKGEHWRSIPPTREALEAAGLPYAIENIQDAAWDMQEPIRLCGSMFGLHVRRHRLFETSFPVMAPRCQHGWRNEIRAYYGKKGWLVWTPAAANVQKKGRKPILRGSIAQAPEDMGIDWMQTWDELREAIPPAYTELLGHQLAQHLEAKAAA